MSWSDSDRIVTEIFFRVWVERTSYISLGAYTYYVINFWSILDPPLKWWRNIWTKSPRISYLGNYKFRNSKPYTKTSTESVQIGMTLKCSVVHVRVGHKPLESSFFVRTPFLIYKRLWLVGVDGAFSVKLQT